MIRLGSDQNQHQKTKSLCFLPEAGDTLGLTKRTVQLYEAGIQPVPRSIALAYRAVELGWRDYDTRELNINSS
jgi:hypothetical protein